MSGLGFGDVHELLSIAKDQHCEISATKVGRAEFGLSRWEVQLQEDPPLTSDIRSYPVEDRKGRNSAIVVIQ